MTNVNDLYPSKYLKSSELGNSRPVVTIERWDVADLDRDGKSERKPVLYFAGKAKGLVLNRTNAQIIESFLGPDIDAWVGKRIRLYVAKVPFQGRLTEAVRVEEPPKVSQPAPPPPPVEASDDEEVPF